MTPQEQLRQKIYEACPELLKLEFGCEVVLLGDAWHEYGVMIRKQKIDNITTGKIEARNDEWKILGKQPHLEHLLRTLGNKSSIEVFSNNTCVLEVRGGAFAYDLTKPPLEQSHETITNLLEILK